MQIDPAQLPWQSMYKILIGAIAPRPIGWISTVDAAGRPNLAPYSFFNIVCPNPPHVLFCPNTRGRDGTIKDSLRNVQASGEFVVNIVGERVAAAMNATSADYPPEINEFEAVGLTAAPSRRVRPPRVAESQVQFECQVTQIVPVGEGPGSGSVVIGRIVYAHLADEVLIGADQIDLAQLQPVGRLNGDFYTRVTDRFEIARPRLT